MSNNDSSLLSLPEEILAPTPSGIRKLLAAWDGLSIESQIRALTAHAGASPIFLERKLATKAFKSGNPYVRYLAYRGRYLSHSDEEDDAIRQAIRNDEDELVRSVLFETGTTLFDNDFKPTNFWALPHSDRLAKVRGLRRGGEEIAAIVQYAVEHSESAIPVIELWEVLADYLKSKEFEATYSVKALDAVYDGMSAYMDSKDLKALWSLVPNVPLHVGLLLVSVLPVKGGMFSEIPLEVLTQMNEYLVIDLLWRKDVAMTPFRKKIYLDEGSKDGMVSAALSSHFDLNNEEFRLVEQFKTSNNSKKLQQIAEAPTLSMVQYAMLAEWATETDDHSQLESIRESKRRASRSLVGSPQVSRTIAELRLFEVAKSLRQGDKLPEQLTIFAQCLSNEGLWSTFLNVENIYKASRSQHNLLNALPEIWNEWEDRPTERVEAGYENVQEKSAADYEKLVLKVTHLQDSARTTRFILIAVLALTCLIALKLFS